MGLRELFGQMGTVADAKVVMDRETGRPRGFAFVEMSSDQEAQKAIEQLNGRDVDGRAINVNEAQELHRWPDRRRRRRRRWWWFAGWWRRRTRALW